MSEEASQNEGEANAETADGKAETESSRAEASSAGAKTRRDFRSGYVALIGRPNAGKSTLLNRLVGQKIAAVSDKPQTTRFKIQGVITKPEGQVVLVDTPGVHQPGYELNRRMMASVQDALM